VDVHEMDAVHSSSRRAPRVSASFRVVNGSRTPPSGAGKSRRLVIDPRVACGNNVTVTFSRFVAVADEQGLYREDVLLAFVARFSLTELTASSDFRATHTVRAGLRARAQPKKITWAGSGSVDFAFASQDRLALPPLGGGTCVLLQHVESRPGCSSV
jgi:hypothetical protein